MTDMFDPDKLQAALSQIGIPCTIQRVTVPADWTEGAVSEPTPAMMFDPDAIGAFKGAPTNNGSVSDTVTISAAGIPAGDRFSLTVFVGADKKLHAANMSVVKGDPGPCVPVPAPHLHK